MSRFAKQSKSHRIRKLEQLEARQAPAIVSFRAGVNGFNVTDTSITAAAPSTGSPDASALEIAGVLTSGQLRQSLIRFENIIGTGPGQIPPTATILNANLVLWTIDGSAFATSVDVRRVLSAWEASTSTFDSWNNGVQADGTEAAVTTDLAFPVTRHGYQIGSLDLKSSVQQWVMGQPNLGWVINTGSTMASWTLASSNHPDVEKRPCLSVEFTAPGYENPSYGWLAGQPPAATKLAWFDWNDSLRNQRVARVPSERPTTFYFAQNGNDFYGKGTIEEPWKTLEKAEGTLLASGGMGTRLRFRRGDVWQETTAMTLGERVSGYTIDDYGDPLLDKPRFSRFMPLNQTVWTQVSGSLYKMTNIPSVGWLREANDGFTRLYYRESSSAAVGNRLDSWFYDFNGSDPNSQGLPSLYLNCGTNPTLVPGGFEACPGDGLGWDLVGDNIRLQNLRLEGYGIRTNGQGYGLKILQQGLFQEFVGIGLEVYFTGYHAIGQIAQYQGTRGITTLIDCSAGYCVNRDGNGQAGSGDITVYVSYGDYGGNEYIQYNCEAKYGTLPSSDWGAAPGLANGSVFYCHIGQGGRLELIILEKTRIVPAQYPLEARNVVDNIVNAVQLEDVRTFIVEDDVVGPSSRMFSDSVAVINSKVDLTYPPPPFASQLTFHWYPYAGAWVINSSFSYNAQNQTFGYFAFINGVLRNKTKFINCHVDIFNHPYNIFWENPGVAEYYFFADSTVTNTIISFSTPGVTALGLMNDADHLRNNAYFLPNLLSPEDGYSGDVGAVTLSGRYPVGVRPTSFSPLYDGGLDVGLEYDQMRQPRGAVNTIGPLNGVAVAPPTAVTAAFGQRSVEIESNEILTSSRINRIRLQFPANTDLGISILKLSSAGSVVPWNGYNYNSTTFIAEWFLPYGLPKGHYVLEIDGQVLRTFSVLPGDLNGDGTVNATDFSYFRSTFGTANILGDLDGDGQVNALDFVYFRQFFGTSL